MIKSLSVSLSRCSVRPQLSPKHLDSTAHGLHFNTWSFMRACSSASASAFEPKQIASQEGGGAGGSSGGFTRNRFTLGAHPEPGPGSYQERMREKNKKFADEWVSLATKDSATSQHRNFQISPRKLRDIIRPLRGLSAEEAMIQMKLSPKGKAHYVMRCIKSACTHAVNNYNMDKSRLVIHTINATKGRYLKRISYHAKGRSGIRFRYYSHLKVAVREQPPTPGEKKLGRHGRSHRKIENTLQKMQLFRAWRSEHNKTKMDQYK
jgi:ribosomal protein L22